MLQNSSTRSDEADCDAPRIAFLLFRKLTARVPFHKWENGQVLGLSREMAGSGWSRYPSTSASDCSTVSKSPLML